MVNSQNSFVIRSEKASLGILMNNKFKTNQEQITNMFLSFVFDFYMTG